MRLTDNDSLIEVNEFISSIAEKIERNQVDIQSNRLYTKHIQSTTTKRLYEKYTAHKQQDIERRKQV